MKGALKEERLPKIVPPPTKITLSNANTSAADKFRAIQRNAGSSGSTPAAPRAGQATVAALSKVSATGSYMNINRCATRQATTNVNITNSDWIAKYFGSHYAYNQWQDKGLDWRFQGTIPNADARYAYTISRTNDAGVVAISALLYPKSGTQISLEFNIKPGGVIQFNYNNNDWWSIMMSCAGKEAAQVMYDVAMRFEPSYGDTRTAAGIENELIAHYAAYKLGILGDNANPADMGTRGKNDAGYDSNAFLFESLVPNGVLPPAIH